MGDPGPEYTLRRPVDIHTPLPIIFHQNDDDDGGYFIQEDGMATKNRPQPMAGAKASREVPTPVVTLIDDETEARKFPPRPAHFMTSNRLDTDVGQSVEYDVDSDDEDVIDSLNACFPPKKTSRPLTPEILESYFDFLDKCYFFTKQQAKLPVKQVLLRRRELQKCLICDFTDLEQAVLECHCCGIMVHSTCYHDLLYSTSLIKGETVPNSTSKKTSSKTPSKARKPATSKGKPTEKSTTTNSKKKRRNADDMLHANDAVNSSKATPSRGVARGGRSRSVSHEEDDEDVESSGDEETETMNVDQSPENVASTLSDVYRAPFVDQVHEDGTWWCAKCSSDDPIHSSCELCGCTSGALFPKFILDRAGKPRILTRRRPFQPLIQPDQLKNEEAEASSVASAKETQKPKPNSSTTTSAAPPPSPYAPVAPFWRTEPRKRRGRRPRTSTTRRETDIIWFHEICARTKPRYYQHLIDPENENEDDEEDEEAIPASDDEAELYEAAIAAKAAPAPVPASPRQAKAASSSKPTAKSVTHVSPTRPKKRTSPPLLGDRNRTCRLCGSHIGACVKCCEEGCGRHFHAHCAEKFGLIVERDEPLRFKCRKHSFPQPTESSRSWDYFPVLLELPEDEAEALMQELTWHDNIVRQGKPLAFTFQPTGPTPSQSQTNPSPAPSTPSKSHGHSSSTGGSNTHLTVTKSFAMPRTLLLPLEDNLPQFVFNYWVFKRTAVGHELVHRLRALKQDETRKQEIDEALSSMETSLRNMVLLRQHMERIRILVDLCKKREALKQQQLDELQSILNLPGLAEHVSRGQHPSQMSPLPVASPQRKRTAPTETATMMDGGPPPAKIRKLAGSTAFSHGGSAYTTSSGTHTLLTSRANGSPFTTPTRSPGPGRPRSTTPKSSSTVSRTHAKATTPTIGTLPPGGLRTPTLSAKKTTGPSHQPAHMTSPTSSKTPLHRRVQRMDVDHEEKASVSTEMEKTVPRSPAPRVGAPHTALHHAPMGTTHTGTMPTRTTRRTTANYANGENGFCIIS